MKLLFTEKKTEWSRCVRPGIRRGMLSVTTQWSYSVGNYLHDTGEQLRALGVINILELLKNLKLDEVNNGQSEIEKPRRPRTEPRGPSTLGSLETKRNQHKSLRKSHQ